MGSARLSHDRERVYSLLSFTPLGEAVLADDEGIEVVLPPEGEYVEIQCDVCGGWTRDVHPAPGEGDGALWLCAYCLRR